MKRHCFSKAVRDVAQGNEEEESFYLGAVSKQRQSSAEHWIEQIYVKHTPVRFRIDTGAEHFQRMDQFRLTSDHKPLVLLINSKDLDAVLVRCQTVDETDAIQRQSWAKHKSKLTLVAQPNRKGYQHHGHDHCMPREHSSQLSCLTA